MTSPKPIIDQDFFKHLTEDDVLGVVVRTHIHIEASIIEFIRARVSFPERIPRLQYGALLRMASALGLRSEYFESLKLLGDIRNDFGHNLKAVLTDKKVNELFSKLPQDGKEQALKAYDMTTDQRGEINAPPFSQLSAKDRFILISVVLKAYVVSLAHIAVSTQVQSIDNQ